MGKSLKEVKERAKGLGINNLHYYKKENQEELEKLIEEVEGEEVEGEEVEGEEGEEEGEVEVEKMEVEEMEKWRKEMELERREEKKKEERKKKAFVNLEKKKKSFGNLEKKEVLNYDTEEEIFLTPPQHLFGFEKEEDYETTTTSYLKNLTIVDEDVKSKNFRLCVGFKERNGRERKQKLDLLLEHRQEFNEKCNLFLDADNFDLLVFRRAFKEHLPEDNDENLALHQEMNNKKKINKSKRLIIKVMKTYSEQLTRSIRSLQDVVIKEETTFYEDLNKNTTKLQRRLSSL